MRGLLLRCATCKPWKDKLIVHLSIGCYTVLFTVSIYLMFYSPRRGSGINKPILIISGLLFLSCSTHFALVSGGFYQIFVRYTIIINTQSLKSPQVVKESNENTLVVSDIFILVTDIIGELILIYRCWLLWSRNYWVIILPSLILIANIGEALMTIPANWRSPTTFRRQYVLAYYFTFC